MPHSFRLQRVLDYRKAMLDRLWQELAAIEVRRQQEHAHVRDLQRAEADTLAALEQRHETGIGGKEVVQLAERLEMLQANIAERLSALRRLGSEADALHRKLEELDKRLKALEHLRDRELAEYRMEEQRVERAVTSEIAATFLRRQQVRP